MAVVNTTLYVGAMAQCAGSTSVSGDLGVANRLRSTAAGRTVIAAALTGSLALQGIAAGQTTESAFLRLSGEPNVLLAAQCDGSTGAAADLRSSLNPFGLAAGSTSISASLRRTQPESWELAMVVDLSADPLGPPGRYVRLWQPRLRVDGAEVPVVDWAYSEAPNTVGGDLRVTLARPADLALFTASSEIDFGLGKRVSGAWDEATFDFLVEAGTVKGFDSSLGWAGTGPSDDVKITASTSLDDGLGRTPAVDEIMYDSDRQTIDASTLDTVLDTVGRPFPPTLVPVPGMTLYSVLSRVLVTGCGFSGFQTNIPDFPVARVDLKMGTPYFDAVKGYFAMFEPVVFAAGDEVWLIDTSIALPAGFPPPRAIGVSEHRTLSVTSERDRVDAILAEYVEQVSAYDYITSATETSTEEAGPLTTDIQRLFREYRRSSHPGIVVRRELYHEERVTTGPGLVTISEMVEDFEFDSLNRMTGRRKTESARVPGESPPHSLAVRQVREERESFTYAAHPFQPRSQYVSNRTLNVSGLVAVDSENQQLGQDFKRDFMTAYRSGNLVESMTFTDELISYRVEACEPQRDGTVRVRVYDYDALADVINRDSHEDRPGDVAVNGLSGQQARVLVFGDDDSGRTSARVETLHMGELPVGILVPLCRRILKSKRDRTRTASLEVIGYDPLLRKGVVVGALGRGGASLGNYLVLGRQAKGDATGATLSLSGKEI